MRKNFGNLKKIIIIPLLLQLLAIQFLVAQPANIPAFPGAEGAGAYASGGRDGDLYFGINLNDSGPGSFREGIDTTPPPVNCSDVNGSGNVDIVDALVIARFYVNPDPNPFIPDNADINGDGAIDIIDALLVAQYYINLIEALAAKTDYLPFYLRGRYCRFLTYHPGLCKPESDKL